MTTTLDALLADAAMPTSSGSFDVAAGLRRLAADAAAGVPTPEVQEAGRAVQRLNIVCRWMVNTSDAAVHVDRLAQVTSDSDDAARGQQPTINATLDVHGAAVFACLLHLTGQPESAQFWWQLSAGAGSRIAAYCLHLHHLALGETAEARHWYHQAEQAITNADDDEDAEAATGADYLRILQAMTGYVRRNGSTASTPPSPGLEAEVHRLASREPSGLVNGPDQQLANRLADFTARR